MDDPESAYQLLESHFGRVEPLSSSDRRLLKAKFSLEVYRPKDRLIDYQEVSNQYFFVVGGMLRLLAYKEGEDKTIFFFTAGDIAGSIESYLSNSPSNFVLEALESTTVLRINRTDLDELFKSSNALGRIGLVLTQLRLTKVLGFYTSLILDKPEERYTKLLETYPEIAQRVPQHLIASFLGITPVSLSRIRKRLQDQGRS